MDSELMALLYVSEITDDAGVGMVGAILSTARRNNAAHGETGVLVFDGERFCQYVEGDASSLRALKANLLADPRHRNIEILANQRIEKRVFDNFRMGYAGLEEGDSLESVARSVADEAISRFMTVVESSDIEH